MEVLFGLTAGEIYTIVGNKRTYILIGQSSFCSDMSLCTFVSLCWVNVYFKKLK